MKMQRFIIWIQTVSFYTQKRDIYKDIAEDVETRFDTSNHELESKSIDRPLPKGENKKAIGLMKD